MIQAQVTRNTQVVHASLVEHMNPAYAALMQNYDLGSPSTLESLNRMVTQQASMIAYVDAFKLMFVATLCVVPLLAIVRSRRRAAGEDAPHVAMD